MQLLEAVTQLVSERARVTGQRSPKWSALRRRHVAANPRCAACGRADSPEAHHLVPVQIAPERELDPTNLITLCGGKRNCHLAVGHGWNWQTYRPQAASLAGAMMGAAIVRPEK
jgi:5-methylcytosine-specific restriction endonuclease McrA